MKNSPVTDDGAIAGNYYDKYGSKNPLVRWMMRGFLNSFEKFVDLSKAKTVHEIGCGEGRLSALMAQKGLSVRACDYSDEIVEKAKGFLKESGVKADVVKKSVYDLNKNDAADLMVCCEVLEHLEDPELAVQSILGTGAGHFIFSVPREPLWRFLNMIRGKYILSLGNTPGHIQHWSSGGFEAFLGRHFDIIQVTRPLPWTMIYCVKKKQ